MSKEQKVKFAVMALAIGEIASRSPELAAHAMKKFQNTPEYKAFADDLYESLQKSTATAPAL